MLRLRIFFAALLLAAIAGTVPAMGDACTPSTYVAGTITVKTMIAGSSAMWQAMALGAYNTGVSIYGNGTTHHFVSSGKSFNLVDTRPSAVGGVAPFPTSTDRAWIVWDGTVVNGKCNSNVWAYLKADSVIGNRALFGSIGGATTGVYVESSTFVDDGGSQISSTLWGDGTTGTAVPPTAIQNLFLHTNEGNASAPNLVNVGATDIDPADAYFASNRVNSTGSTNNGDEGLGYNVNNTLTTPPDCVGGVHTTLAKGVGTAILEDTKEGTSSFPVVAFNLSGQDPFNCTNLPAFTTIPVGASPIVVVKETNGGQLNGLTNATEAEIGRVFAGLGNAAGAFSGCPACAGFVAYLREPLSGTYNTFEETIARHPSSLSVYRYSQENGNVVNGAGPTNNPLNNAGPGYRYRAIGTGDEVAAVQKSVANHGKDGIGYTFFSFGNVSPLTTVPANYSYIMVNGVDPIFHNYNPGSNGITDPAQPAVAGELPNSTTNLPTTCVTPAGAANPHAFPCNENVMWQADNYAQVAATTVPSYSFPNVRNGSYPSWSLLRLVAAGGASNATDLVNASNIYVVTTVPDYVPFNFVQDPVSGAFIDPGLQVLRSHFGCTTQTCGSNSFTGAPNDPSQGTVELGRDAGGAILSFLDSTIQITQDGFGVVSFQ